MALYHGQERVNSYYKMGKVIRFKKSDIEAFLERSRVERTR